MRRWGVLGALVIVVTCLTVPTVPSGAQEAVSVSITLARGGFRVTGCGGAAVGDPGGFQLTRTGATTDGLAVNVAWSGDLADELVETATVAQFAPGSATTTIAPQFASPNGVGTVTLTVEPGSGYQVGDPATTTVSYSVAIALCPVAPPPTPPVTDVSPSFTG